MTRIEKKFQQLRQSKQTAFIPYICAGHPDYETSLNILKNLPKAGADIIELGVPFLDPAGDGPTIESASKQAIKNGASLKSTLKMANEFRQNDQSTPILLMGYYNSFLKYGLDDFFDDAKKSGIDAVLIVDLPNEEQDEISQQLAKFNINFINLISPISDDARITKIANKKYSSGFLYLLSMLGITGTKDAELESNKANLAKVRAISSLPICVGFGIKTPEQAAKFAEIGFDGVIIGSAIVKEISSNQSIEQILQKVKEFSQAIKSSAKS